MGKSPAKTGKDPSHRRGNYVTFEAKVIAAVVLLGSAMVAWDFYIRQRREK